MATRAGRVSATTHESFLSHAGYRWLKVAGGVSLVAILAYALIDVSPRHNGGSWYGYILGTVGALLILWLTVLGVRKRAITPGRWSLKAWTSAHVYLGLSLIVVGTLHTGFQFGWNVHTLAYTLMMLVILSGIYGIVVYARLPRELSANRAETTQSEMLASIRALDRQLHDAAQPLARGHAELVQRSLEESDAGGSLRERLTGNYRSCGNRAALDTLREQRDPNLTQVLFLLERKESALALARRHARIKAYLEIWLYVHVPMTFALIAALVAHVVSVFFYW